MDFKEAFWSSSIPKETIADITRLRNGMDSISRGRNVTGSISLQEIQTEADAVVAQATASGNVAQAAAAAEVAAAAAEAAKDGVPDITEERSSDIEEARGSRSSTR